MNSKFLIASELLKEKTGAFTGSAFGPLAPLDPVAGGIEKFSNSKLAKDISNSKLGKKVSSIANLDLGKLAKKASSRLFKKK